MTVATADAGTVWQPSHSVPARRVLGGLRRGTGDPTHRVAADGALWRTALTPNGPATLRLTETGAGVAAEAWGAGADWLVERVPRLLGADDDPAGFHPHHELLRDAWRRLAPLPLPSTGLVFEMLVPAILEQRVTGHEARASWRVLLHRYGTAAPGPAPAGMRVFPPAEAWRRIPSWEWHRANVTPQRMRCVLAAAQVGHRLDQAIELPRAERLRRLRAVPGIGRWTAAEVAQRAWGDPDEVSYGDYHIAALVGWALLGRPVDDDGMMELLEPYAGHRQRAVRLIELSFRKPRFGPRMTPGNIVPL